MTRPQRRSVCFFGDSSAYDVHRRALSSLPCSFSDSIDSSADIFVIDAALPDWSLVVIEVSAPVTIVVNPWLAERAELARVAATCVSKGLRLTPDTSALTDVERYREDLLFGTKTDPILAVDVWLERAPNTGNLWLGSLIAQELALLRTIGLTPTAFDRETFTASSFVLLAALQPTILTLSGVKVQGGTSRFEIVLLTSSTRRSLTSSLSGPVFPARLELDSSAEQRRNRPVYASGARHFWMNIASSTSVNEPSDYGITDWLADLTVAESVISR